VYFSVLCVIVPLCDAYTVVGLFGKTGLPVQSLADVSSLIEINIPLAPSGGLDVLNLFVF